MGQVQPAVMFCLILVFLLFSIFKLVTWKLGRFHITKIHISGPPENKTKVED